MSKKPEKPEKATVLLPMALKNEFRALCIVQDLKPHEKLAEIVKLWIKNEKKKTNSALVANG